jgi:hypothetical protein
MKKSLLILLLTIPFVGFGQGWEKTFGGSNYDEGHYVQQTKDGGYIIIGKTESFGNGDRDVLLLKTDENGDSLWIKTFGGKGEDVGVYGQQTSDGGYIIVGSTESFGNGKDDNTLFETQNNTHFYKTFERMDLYVIKTDENGDSLWTKTFGGKGRDDGREIQQTSDGGYIIVGDTKNDGNWNVYLNKINENGDLLWTKTFEGSGNSVKQTTDGGYIITNGTFSLRTESSLSLKKTDENGNLLWNKSYGTNFSGGGEIQQTSDGGYIIVGNIDKGTNWDIYLIKTNSKGDSLWTKTFGGKNYESGSSVQQTSDGGYILTGGSSSFGNKDSSGDMYLVKTDENGDSLWIKTFGGKNYDIGFSIQQTKDGGYIITGITESFGNGKWDVYLIKTDKDGNVFEVK